MKARDLFARVAADLEPPPEGWWHDLDDDEIEFLNSEGRTYERAVVGEADRQERKATILMAWSLALLSASGLFGDLDLGRDAAGLASWVALATTGLMVAAATYVFWPRNWYIGLNLAQLARRAGSGTRELLGQAVDALVSGYCVNMRLVRGRARAVDLMTILLPLQSLAVVAVEITA